MRDIKERVLSFNIHSNGDSSIFISKLMLEHSWTKSFTLTALSEYKKFIYLLYISKERLSPSKVIDKVWHCHLTFTHSYWNELCRDLLKKDIHHIPSSIDKICKELDTHSYERSLSHYRAEFGQPNPKIWGNIKLKKSYWIPLIFVSLFLTACSFGTDSDIDEIYFWVAGIYVGYLVLKWIINNFNGGGGGSGGGCSSSCGGGCGGS